MQENYQEALDKMFPDGYVIYYTCPDENARISYWNPHRLKQIYDVHDLIIDTRQEEDSEFTG